MKKKLIITAIVILAIVVLWKKGAFDTLLGKVSPSGGSSPSGDSSPSNGLGGEIPANALFNDYKGELQLLVNRLNVKEAWEETTDRYPTEKSFRDQLMSWVKNIWLSAKNNDNWTQAGVRQAAAKNGVTYNQQIVLSAIWQMREAEASLVVNPDRKESLKEAFAALARAVEAD